MNCDTCNAPVGPTSPCRTCPEPGPVRPHRGLEAAARLGLWLLALVGLALLAAALIP